MTSGNGGPKGYWQVGCTKCKLERRFYDVREVRSAIAQHERENKGHKCGNAWIPRLNERP